jgi:hypothetical protein
MMKYEDEDLGVKFSLPDKFTVRDQLKYNESILMNQDIDIYSRAIGAIQPFVEDWECELVPDIAAVDLDEETDPRIARIISYVGLEALGHMAGLEDVSKNS